MTDLKDTLIENPGKLLSMAQLLVLICTIVYLFAFMRADVNRNAENIKIQQDQIENNRDHNRNTYVRRDVFNEQYRQIIQRLDNLNKKLDD